MWAFPNALDYWILRFAVSFVYGIDIFMHLKRIWRHTLPSNTQVRWTTWQVATLMMRMLCSQYPLATFSHDKLGIWSGLFGRKLFSVIFASFFFVFFFCMDQSQNIFDGSNTGCTLPSGQGAYRDLWWRPVTELREATPQPSWSVRCQWTQDVFILDISQNPPNFLHTVRRLGDGMDASSSNDSPDRRTCIKGDAVDRCWWYSSWCFCRLKWAPKLCLTWPSHRMQQLTSLLATSFWECCSLAHETKTTSPSFFTKERLKWKEYVQGSFIPFG